MKDEHLKEREKQREIVSLLGSLDDEKFALLAGLGRKITDYGADKSTAAEGLYVKSKSVWLWVLSYITVQHIRLTTLYLIGFVN